MPLPTDTSPKALFNKFKSRPQGGERAAFILENDGTFEIIKPSEAKILTPQKLKARLKGKGVGGTFFKSSNGPVFEVQAGKKGGHAGQPWVKYILRSTLQVSTFEVTTATDADIDESGPQVVQTTTSTPELDLLDTEDTSQQEVGGLDLLDTGTTQDELDLDGLDELDETPLLIERDGKKNIQEEWDRLDELEGDLPLDYPDPDKGLKKVLRTDQMFNVSDTIKGPTTFNEDLKVHAPLTWEDVSKGELGKAQERLVFERKATRWLRSDMTKSVSKRTGRAKESVEANCDMASKLAGMLESNPELIAKGGLLNRIMGTLDGQGQHEKGTEASVIATKIREAATRLKDGTGEGEDANFVLQFIGCFTDGLTEVVEAQDKRKKAVKEGKEPTEKEAVELQLEQIWGGFCEAFGVATEDQESFQKSLLDRVANYKAIAGGRSDTLSGKGGRKTQTRAGINPQDPRQRMTEHEALIKGDISGSVHSCFLAYELAESLKNPESLKTESDVLLTDKGLINARVVDALALTAGGTSSVGGTTKEHDTQDNVFHTTWEMLNGLRGITGAPKLTQDQATTVMEYLWKGKGYTTAMEALFPEEQFQWMPKK